MNQTKLYIENQEVELNDAVQFAITKQFEDITNPTVIINDWSKTVEIPATQRNDELFGHIYNTDKIVVEEAEPSILTKISPNIVKHSQVIPSSTYYTTSIALDAYEVKVSCKGKSGASGTVNGITFVQGYQSNSSSSWNVQNAQTILTITEPGTYEVKYTPRPSSGTTQADNCIGQGGTWGGNAYPSFVFGAYSQMPAFLTGREVNLIINVTKLTLGRFANYEIEYTLRVQAIPDTYSQKKFGVYFDPYKKMDFRLEWNDDVIMSGYAKMTEIVRKDTNTTYNVTLNGTLGKLFQEYKKITFDNSAYNDTETSGDTEVTKYIVSGSTYYEQQINKELVWNSWNNNRDVTHTQVSAATPYEIVGFTPTNAYAEDFDYTSYCYLNDGDEYNAKFEDALPSDFLTKTQMQPSTVIGDGVKPRDLGEFRSYHQQPFLWWDMYWQIFQKKAEELCGYKWIMDEKWFNVNNPYWRNFGMLAKNFPVKGDDNLLLDENETYLIVGENEDYSYKHYWITWGQNEYWDTTRWGYIQSSSLNACGETSDTICKDKSTPSNWSSFKTSTWTDGQYFLLPVNSQITIKLPNAHLGLGIPTGNSAKYARWNPTTSYYQRKIHIRITLYDIDDDEVLFGYGNEYTPDFYEKTYDSGTDKYQINSHPININPQNYIKAINKLDRPRRLKLKINTSFVGDATGSPLQVIGDGWTAWQDYGLGQIILALDGDFPEEVTSVFTIFRSFNKFNYNDLWDNDYNPFDSILNYCKQFRIGVYVDDVAKTVTFKPINQFLFEGLNRTIIHNPDTRDITYDTFEDWSDKVDYLKDFKVTPITWENKYIKFNYDETELKDNEVYNKEYGLNYGEKKISTEYNFNTETNDLFSGLKQNIQFTPYVLSWDNLTSSIIIYTLPRETYIEDIDSDNKKMNMFGTFGIVSTKQQFDNSSNLRSVIITDDTDLMIQRESYFYNQTTSTGTTTGTTYYCSFSDRVQPDSDIVLSVFNQPSKSFTYVEPKPAKDVYTLFWKDFVEARYDKNNKIITCYIRLTPEDFINFNFNKFIKIDNQLYMVNKIYDYDMTSYESTKVDLISIQDANKFYNNGFEELFIYKTTGIATTPIKRNAQEVVYSTGYIYDDLKVYLGNTAVTFGKLDNNDIEFAIPLDAELGINVLTVRVTYRGITKDYTYTIRVEEEES